MYGLDSDVAPEYYGQATDGGHYDDVETYGDGSEYSGPNSSTNSSAHLALLFIVVALAGLWLMGGALFKGSNHS